MGRRGLLLLLVLLAVAACQPVKKAPPQNPWIENPPGLPPAIPDGPPPPNSPTLTKTDFVTGLSTPWDVAFLPNGEMLFDERARGSVKVRHLSGAVEEIIAAADIPDLLTANEFFGLLGMAVDPQFATNGFIYTCYTAKPPADDIRVVRWTLDQTTLDVTSRTPIVTGIPLALAPNLGCRVRFGFADDLWITTGDVHNGNVPQDLGGLGGKILRVTRDGAPYSGNPFGTRVYTYGHRNPQGIAFEPASGQPYSIEHGTNRDDEVNRLTPGGNGGWDPKPGYNENVPMTDLVKFPRAIPAFPHPASADWARRPCDPTE
ncbi:MAG: PQQ-dependent sugar dehydrogenase [Acidimicrobiia bacterium]